MSTAAWAVIGVFVGATLQFVAHLLSERRADRRADADRLEARDAREEAREEARDSRLFDVRRTAYEDFQSVARGLLNEGWEGHHMPDAPPPDYDFADRLLDSLGPVRLYGSRPTVVAAEDLYQALVDYGASDSAEMNKAETAEAESAEYRRVDEAITRFALAARADLGGA
ncbi:MAG: hypothetical protein PGN15_09770 [Aeromicrobium erythreum]